MNIVTVDAETLKRMIAEAVKAEREALRAQPAPVQEPVGTYGEIHESMQALLRSGLQKDQQIYMAMKDKPLYTTPPAAQRQWVGLTPREIYNLWEDSGVPFVDWDSFASIAQAIEAKLTSKNGGAA